MERFTAIHVVISLIGILSGLVVMFGMLASKPLDGWTVLFLVTTATTSLTRLFGSGTNRARTCDLMRVKHALFQLSYDPFAEA